MNGRTMADKLGLGPEVRELKLGPSFSSDKGTAFHTLRYDFKPASVDENKVATVDVGTNQQVTVTVPHLDGSGTMQTVFKGSHKPYQRECVLILDRNTGEVTLEKLSKNIQLKKTRLEPHKPSGGGGISSGFCTTNNLSTRPGTPTESIKASPTQHQSSRQSHKVTKTLSGTLPKHSPLHASPSHAHKSPTTGNHIVQKSPTNLSLSPVMHGSLPLIGLDDINDSSSNCFPNSSAMDIRLSPDFSRIPGFDEDQEQSSMVGVLSSSSSSSSSESNSSDSESDSLSCNNDTNKTQPSINGHLNGTISPALSMPDHLLNEDLQLSESGSDSD